MSSIIPGSWQAVTCVTLTLVVVGGFLSLLRKRPNHRPRIRVGLDARHGYAPRADERDTVALFRRIVVDQRTRLGI